MIRNVVIVLVALGVNNAGAGELVAPTVAAAPLPEQTELAAQAAVVAGELGAKLKAELQAALAAGGPLAAVSSCKDRAQPLTVEHSKQTGWDVRRTSLRLRNPDNAPDAWERGVLESFATRYAAGESPAAIEHQEMFTVGEHQYFRYMKAISVAEMCTVCHGKSVSHELQTRIRRLYPDDHATGYAPGELRGAFSLTRKVR